QSHHPKEGPMPTRRQLFTPVILGSVVVGLAACGDDDPAASESVPPAADTATPATEPAPAGTDSSGASGEACAEGGPEIVIGAQDFGESAILSEIYGQALEQPGCSVSQQALGGYRDLVFTSFEA